MTSAATAGERICITCRDEATPMRVLARHAREGARCLDGCEREHLVATDFVEPVRLGETLLVHAGVAIGRAAR